MAVAASEHRNDLQIDSSRNALRICFITDARSPIAHNWIRYFIERGDEVHIISSFPCLENTLPGARLYQASAALSGFSRTSQPNKAGIGRAARAPALSSFRDASFTKLSLAAQHVVLPIDVRRHVRPVRDLIVRIAPDIVHAMRIPFEGIIAAKATPKGMPLLVSVWGNDFTFWARNPIIARQTRQALNRADALHSDCRRDIRLAVQSFGFDGRKAAKVLPGAGGIQAEVFHPGEPDTELRKQLGISTSAPVVINPRGPRGNVCNDVFFNAIPIILNECPKAVFLCSAMQGNTKAETSVNRLAIQGSVRLLPRVPREWMSNFFRLASVTVSPSLHDGTPNTLLEAMACGCFPIVGDIESVREWITDGINGLVCDATNPQSIAQTIIRALHDPQLRGRASEHNVRLISERAEYNKVMLEAEQFYHQVLGQAGSADGV